MYIISTLCVVWALPNFHYDVDQGYNIKKGQERPPAGPSCDN